VRAQVGHVVAERDRSHRNQHRESIEGQRSVPAQRGRRGCGVARL